MLSDEWLSRYGLLENFNASVTRTGTGTWTTGVTAIALCISCSRAKNVIIAYIIIEATFKRQIPCSNHEIHVPFEHGFWLKSVDTIGHFDMTSLFSSETNMADTQEIPCFW